MYNNISIGKLDRASCENLNIRNQKGWVAVEWMPTKGYSRVIGTARIKEDLMDILEGLSNEEEAIVIHNESFEMSKELAQVQVVK